MAVPTTTYLSNYRVADLDPFSPELLDSGSIDVKIEKPKIGKKSPLQYLSKLPISHFLIFFSHEGPTF